MSDFGTRLRNIRKSERLTQRKLAQESGIPERTIQMYELNESLPSFEALVKLADFFGITIDYLIGRKEINRKPTSKTKVQK
jgi:transcriptional regulator with XRE-family HTH domain